MRVELGWREGGEEGGGGGGGGRGFCELGAELHGEEGWGGEEGSDCGETLPPTVGVEGKVSGGIFRSRIPRNR